MKSYFAYLARLGAASASAVVRGGASRIFCRLGEMLTSVSAKQKGPRRLSFLLWPVCLAMFLHVLPLAAAPAVPSPAAGHFYVLDQANVLSDAGEYKIQALSSQLAAKTNAQVVVVTIPSLQGTSIEEYAVELFRKWGIGGKQQNNGVLLLVAVDDRQSRIEVAYGLEGALPDGKTGRIRDEQMVPYFKNGEYEMGIQNGYAAVVNEVAKEYNVTLTAPPAKPQGGSRNSTSSWDTMPWWGKLLLGLGLASLIIIDVVFFGGRFTWLLLSIFMRGGRGGGGGSDGGKGGGGSTGGGGSSGSW